MTKLLNTSHALLLTAVFGLALLTSGCNKANPEAKAKEVADGLCKCLTENMKAEDSKKEDECLKKVMDDAKAYKEKLSATDQEIFDKVGQEATKECEKKILESVK